MRRSKLKVANGESLLYGNNFGPYPKRSFYNFSSLGQNSPHCPVALHSCGIDQWHCKVFRERVKSDTFSVEMVVDGVFNYTLDGKSYQVNPGEIFFVQLGMDSSMYCETETATKKLVIISGGLLPQVLEYLELNRIAVLKPCDLSGISAIFDRIIELSKTTDFENYRNVCSETYRLLLELSAQNIALNRPAGLQRAIEYIHENVKNPVSLEKIIAAARVSGATLHRQFRKYMNISPIEYYLNVKMEMAHEMLKTEHFSVKEVSSRLNYSSPQYFASEFKKRYGKTPRSIK